MPVTAHEPPARLRQLRGRAQGLVEYGLIVALVAVVAVAGLVTLGPALRKMLMTVGASV